MARLKVLFVASECVPFAKTGGLADVVGALPLQLARHGHDVRVVLPRYECTKKFPAASLGGPINIPVGLGSAWCGVRATTLPGSNVPTYFIEHDALFHRSGIYGDAQGAYGDNLARFTVLSRGAFAVARAVGFTPDILHAHDWQSSLATVYARSLESAGFENTATVLSLHNVGFQGTFSPDEFFQTQLNWNDHYHPSGLEHFGQINVLKGGLWSATMLSTVSPRYALEIQTPEGGHGLDGVMRARAHNLIGILNGIDETAWNPETDRFLTTRYSRADLAGKAGCKASLQDEFLLPRRPDLPLLAMVARLSHQKGVDLLLEALPHILELGVQVVIVGSGDVGTETALQALAHSHDQLRVRIAHDEGLAHRVEAGADLFLMPSLYEPCGLNQMYSQRYGTLPIVRAVGGLDDTVEHRVTGFKFGPPSPEALFACVRDAVFVWREERSHFRWMQDQAMQKELGWASAATQYEALYRLSIHRHRFG